MPASARSTRKSALPKEPPRARDADTETRILDAARRVFVRRGTAGARMQEIANEAEVNQALVHYYFGSKNELAERVFLEAAAGAVQMIAPIGRAEASLEDMLDRFVHAYIETVRKSPFVPAYLLAEAHQHPERLNVLLRKAVGVMPSEIAGMMVARIDGVLAARVASGKMRPISTQQFLINVMSLVVFPFVARPVLFAAFGFSDDTFNAFLDERRRELPGFILNALRP